MNDDRTVHGRTAQGQEIARYDRAGAWYLEGGGGPDDPKPVRTRVSVAIAAQKAWIGVAYLGKPGGVQFDAKVRRLREQYKR